MRTTPRVRPEPATPLQAGDDSHVRVVCTVGPESTGKTTLCRALAVRFRVPWLPEYAREHLTGKSSYNADTVAVIAREQQRRERRLLDSTTGPVLLDTDLAVIFVWWREKYGHVPAWIDAAWAAQEPRLYLLCRPDLAWQPDPLRESRHDLDRLYENYRTLLTTRRLRIAEIGGHGPTRTAAAVTAAGRYLNPRRPTTPTGPVESSSPEP